MNRKGQCKKEITLEDNSVALAVYGQESHHLRMIEELMAVTLSAMGNVLTITGECVDVEMASRLVEQLYSLAQKGYPLTGSDVENAIMVMKEAPETRLKDLFLDNLLIHSERRRIAPKTITQKLYVEAIRKNDVVFGIGPAGTGKTYLAMAMAVASFLKNEVSRIILTRPAVEAGEKLGFLPGDLAEKVNPYLRPLYDALYDMLAPERVARLLDEGVIEVAPLAFMRGRTLNDAFIILDEAQNTTSEQMKMFLTRLGYGSKAVITGDITQIDLPHKRHSGLLEARKLLQSIKGIGFIHFSQKDVVRHKLVRLIIQAYEESEGAAGEDEPSGS